MNTIRNGIVGAICFVLLAAPSTALAEFKPSAALQVVADVLKLCSTSLSSADSLHACFLAKKSQASQQCQAQYEAETKSAAHK